MRSWLAIVVSILAVAGGVLYASQVQRTTAEENIGEARLAQDIRASMIDAELALDQGVAGRPGRAPVIDAGLRRTAAGLHRLAALVADDKSEVAAVRAEASAMRGWAAASAAERGVLAGRQALSGVKQLDGRIDDLDGRVNQISAFAAASDRLLSVLDRNRHREMSAAALVPVEIVIVLSAIFLLAGGFAVRQARLRRRRLRDAQALQAASETSFQQTQRRLSEALQVAADQREAHGLLRTHLERTIPGSSVHILNRNNSADRLEATTELAEGSPLAEALVSSEPRSCIAVRLSRPFDGGPDSAEVLECELCGKLAGESSCRPLLVGGEVIGSVLIEKAGAMSEAADRRVDESVTAAAPVLANLRNLAIAEMRAATDALTGLPNRRSQDDAIKRMVAQASRSMRPLSVVMLDLDHFKQINDTFGHERGDSVLAGFGALLRSGLRAADFAARSGGEEFMMLLPDTDRQGALQLAEKLRRNVHALRAEGIDRRVTASMGVAVFPEDAADEETLLRLADRALYSAKQHGRDRVETVSEMGTLQVVQH